MHITGAERLILIGGLLQGVLCLDFAALMPQNIKALHGSCVAIPCSFTLRSGFESSLTTSCKGIWRKGWTGVHVFDSSLTGTGFNTIEGNLTGNLQQKECTTILNDLSSFNDYFSFRIECDNALKYIFPERVTINVKENPSKPTLSPETVNVMEGTTVNLICSAAAPCPSLPPTLTWTPTLSDSVEDLQETPNRVITSLLNFTASHVHHGEKITCTALYKRQAGKSDKSSKTYLTVAVLCKLIHACSPSDSPKNTSVSVSPPGSVAEGSSVTLTCSSNANPAVKNYTWYRVEGSEKDIVGSDKDLNIFNVTRLSNEQYNCKAQNVHGLQTSEAISINVTFASEIQNTSHCIRISDTSQIRCFCDSYGNPAPTLVWQLAGESVNHSTNTIIREEPIGRAGLRSSLTIHQSQEEEIPSLVCLSSNFDVFDSFSFDLTSMKTYEGTGFHLLSLLIGAGVGAGVMMLLCIPMLLICKHRRARQSPNKRQEDTAEFIVTDETLFQEEDNVYANKAMLDEALWPNRTVDREIDDTDLLHYVNLNFSKLQAKVAERGEGEGEIRGVASKTTEYAVIRLHSTGSIEGGAGKKEANPALEQGDHAEDHGAKVLEESQAGHESGGEEEVAKDSALPELQGVTNSALSVQESPEAPLGESEQHNTAETAVDEVTLLSEPKDSSNCEEEEMYGNICRGQVISDANYG
ncbi:myelin-associated glycoprotein-like [Salvelinus fontinalis]|uniref:myelin-associated glycoprotein-like n=1 Tax=Salvelinus fontinalis TaxID=8038 RepID=UPI0024861CBD|nr:myelin-associated glycoprotein-like [Salvelinus fontinalis]